MLVILKIPVAYLCAVVWWAIKAEPLPLEGAARLASLEPAPECDWRRRRHERRIRPRPPRSGRVNARAGTREEGWTATDAVAGILAALSIFASALGLVYRPARLLPFAVLLALVAGRMSARNDRLALFAVVAAVVCWTVGMTIAIVTENPIY